MLLSSETIKGILAVVIASLLWGTTGTAASLSSDVSPLAIGAFSMGVGGLMMALTNIRSLFVNYRLLIKRKSLFAIGTLSVAIYPLAFYSSMYLSGVAIGTIVSIATAPIFAAVLERLFNQKPFSKKWSISCTFGVIGVILLTTAKEPTSDETSNLFLNTLGIILGCIAGLTYACYSWVARSFIEKGIDSKTAISGLFGGAAILLLPSLLFTGENLFLNVTNSAISLYMAIVPMFLGYLLFAYGLTFIEASNATLITLLEPLMATVLAVLLLGESFKLIAWVGALLVLLCLIVQSINLTKINISFSLQSRTGR
ncbi:DMT family transporter [Pseudoalteromonas maricaloris]|uniref:EamA family transporter n=1 Tax=Pseudoalteromonas maricaloris TaxID=184924 RepID=A0A8I2KLW7_9GAMM|nr:MULTISPECIES: EamA family transporter [Pseudoalteromonas]KID33806.1 membrane protein [Pseudoalteromonas flavipulchra NCIMB 2033 = ATCC BAA-314]MBD0782179.1 EamA family transporter [Pseudoalteromonas flavipulchra]MBE0375901.1 drug/metabolite transporter, DME family [Pseudoalteromonas flavipulchra NCIMB 2033 = ATCC BAA-314]NLR20991.1 EamA family transporter [Pseudoalteromonas maricaloris]WOX30770.1 EamA family transporter [Pseudoalteromonas maricaloris]